MAKELSLLHKYEDDSYILNYDYRIHTWRWDAKFYLVGEDWCTSLENGRVVGHLDDSQRKRIESMWETIERKERENANYIAFQLCRKRTCLCKKCDKHLSCMKCVSCKEKVLECDEKDND